jgi:beta-glucosidase
LIEEAATVMGRETRANGATVLLGPGINILRDPLGGRFFEYYTEDPFLNSEMTVAFVQGVQSQNVAVCLKHFACNNREENRNNYMSYVSRRALNEIYFPAFKAGVERGHAWAVMTSANGVNGEFVSDSRFMLTDTLKGRWGFDGMVMTDWLGTRSTEKAALAGLDVSMPYSANSGFGQPLLDAVRAGKIPESVVDDKARRVLRTMARVGLLDGVAPKTGGSKGTPEHIALSRHVAEESLVLLKNENNFLPLNPAALKKVLVVGPNANQRFCLIGLGGSSWQESPYEVTALQGVTNWLGTNAQVQFIPSDELGGFEVIPASVLQTPAGRPGMHARYFKAHEDEPVVERDEAELSFLWEMHSPEPKTIPPERFKAEFAAQIMPPVSGTYTLRITAGGGSAWVFVDPTGGAPLMFADTGKHVPSSICSVQMEAGKPFFIRVDYTKSAGDAACRLEWALPLDPAKRATAFGKLSAAAREADAVLVFAGLDHSLDSEGRDRLDMKFPELQQDIIHTVAAANPRTVVTLINGSPLALEGWSDEVPAILEAWYGGMEAGSAIADTLFGRNNPSGKLPFTWPKKMADSPAHVLGRQNADRVDYLEDVFVGYRYYDSRNVAPQFPFGYGLSYTKFDFSGLTVHPQEGAVQVTFAVKNTGRMAGGETAQVYVRPPPGKVPRPVHELKGFKKVFLQPGETRFVTVPLPCEAFAYFDENVNDWVVAPGEYTIEVGDSSRNVVLTQPVAR